MIVRHSETGTKGAFYIEVDGERLGDITYSREDNNLVIHHTEVSEKLKGQGAGKQLVVAVAEFAREKELHIIPHCPFARRVLEKMPEYTDLVKE
jgi:predicted GNAT family acetyltransferase